LADDERVGGEKRADIEEFESRFDRLEELVAELESGDLPLAGMLSRYEEAFRLLRTCVAILDAAERRVELLLKDAEGGIVGSEPLEASEA